MGVAAARAQRRRRARLRVCGPTCCPSGRSSGASPVVEGAAEPPLECVTTLLTSYLSCVCLVVLPGHSSTLLLDSAAFAIRPIRPQFLEMRARCARVRFLRPPSRCTCFCSAATALCQADNMLKELFLRASKRDVKREQSRQPHRRGRGQTAKQAERGMRKTGR